MNKPQRSTHKTAGYCSDTLCKKRDRRREEAERRKDQHDALSLKEKLVKISSRRGNSKRELSRLT